MSKYYKAFNTLKGPITHLKNIVSSAIRKKGKVSPTIKSVPPSKRNKDFAEQKEKISKTVDKYSKGVNEETKLKMRGGTSKTLGKISKILRGEKKDGGRIGKMGGGMMGRRFGMKKGSSKGKVPTTPKEKAFGMLSVKKGLDNNKNITFTDKIAGAKKA